VDEDRVARLEAVIRATPWMTVAFHDPLDLSHAREVALEHVLAAYLPGVAWDPKNQAAVHTWYQARFCVSVEPLGSAVAGVATWPETATAVAVCLQPDDGLEVSAPCGLADLLEGVCRRNPSRVTMQEYRRRVVRKRVAERWPRSSSSIPRAAHRPSVLCRGCCPRMRRWLTNNGASTCVERC
jgi:hypothetical protein